VLIAALTTAVVAAPSEAGKKKKKRTAETNYVGSHLGVVPLVPDACVPPPLGCAVFEVKPGERFVDLEIQDDFGQPVYASVYVYGFSDGSETHEHICGTTEDPLALFSGLKQLMVVIELTGGVLSGCPGPPTEGTIAATFSNRR
jgi:hypothetical protein